MKKTSLLLIIVFLISACANDDITQNPLHDEQKTYTNETTQNTSHDEQKTYTNNSFMFITDTPDEFKEYLFSNQIDADMKHEDETSGIYKTSDILTFYQKYFDLWRGEMNSVYEDLLAELEGEARELLRESQESWEITSHNDSDLWHHIFSVTKGHGSLDSAFIAPQKIDNIRRRTFLLAEYYFWLTGDFKFTYDKKETTDWQKTYINYFENSDYNTIDSIYIGDINGDEIPEVVVPNIGVLYYYDNEIYTIEFLKFALFRNHYNEDTNRFLIEGGGSGETHSIVYDFIDGKYEISYYRRMEKEYSEDGGAERYYINEVEITYEEALAEIDKWNEQISLSRCLYCYEGCEEFYDPVKKFSSEYDFVTIDDVGGNFGLY